MRASKSLQYALIAHDWAGGWGGVLVLLGVGIGSADGSPLRPFESPPPSPTQGSDAVSPDGGLIPRPVPLGASRQSFGFPGRDGRSRVAEGHRAATRRRSALEGPARHGETMGLTGNPQHITDSRPSGSRPPEAAPTLTLWAGRDLAAVTPAVPSLRAGRDLAAVTPAVPSLRAGRDLAAVTTAASSLRLGPDPAAHIPPYCPVSAPTAPRAAGSGLAAAMSVGWRSVGA